MDSRNPALTAFANHIRALARNRAETSAHPMSPEGATPDDSLTHQRYRNWYRSTTN